MLIKREKKRVLERRFLFFFYDDFLDILTFILDLRFFLFESLNFEHSVLLHSSWLPLFVLTKEDSLEILNFCL